MQKRSIITICDCSCNDIVNTTENDKSDMNGATEISSSRRTKHVFTEGLLQRLKLAEVGGK